MTPELRHSAERRAGGDRRSGDRRTPEPGSSAPERGSRGFEPERRAPQTAGRRTPEPGRRQATSPEPPLIPDTILALLLDRTEPEAARLRAVAQMLSHELRTPLTTIYSGSKLLSRRGPPLSETQVRDVSSAIEADAERLLRVVEDLVVAAGLPGEPVTHGEPVLLQHLVPAAARLARSRWPDLDIDVLLPDQLPAVQADEVYLEQLLRNLLDNAAQYGPVRGRIVVSAQTVGDRIQVHVLDEGPGVDPDQAEDLFRLFVGPGTPSQAGGLGLGLFVGRRLAEQMRGRLWVEPRAGGGSDFVLDLPASPVDDR
jgi:two-component system, OmpR family, sensor histidine kinase KdpD